MTLWDLLEEVTFLRKSEKTFFLFFGINQKNTLAFRNRVLEIHIYGSAAIGAMVLVALWLLQQLRQCLLARALLFVPSAAEGRQEVTLASFRAVGMRCSAY